MVPEKIQVSIGGENLNEVLGRKEEDELLVFLNGVFERHTMRDLISLIRVVGEKDFACDEWIEEPTLLVTCFEFANMFHTVIDW
ncbi:hypothetical protein K1719_034331 [Acacia pycnantha]|nr:hypothetical protein K1719_034331 [Acacia pycnantha]